MMEGETIICAENGRLTQSHVVASEWQTQKKLKQYLDQSLGLDKKKCLFLMSTKKLTGIDARVKSLGKKPVTTADGICSPTHLINISTTF